MQYIKIAHGITRGGRVKRKLSMEKETAFGYFLAWGCGIIVGILILIITGNVCPIELQEEESSSSYFTKDMIKQCGAYYPVVIEDFATNNFMYLDENYTIHNGTIPSITTDKMIKTCIAFRYNNDVYEVDSE